MAVSALKRFKLICDVFQRLRSGICAQNLLISERLFCTTNQTEKDLEVETLPIVYVERKTEFGTSRKYARMKLEELFKLTKNDSYQISMKCKNLSQVTGKMMSDNYNLCKKEGITNSTLLNNLDIIADRHLKQKINLLKNLPFHLDQTATLLNLLLYSLHLFVRKQVEECREIPGGRISYFADVFEVCKEKLAVNLIK